MTVWYRRRQVNLVQRPRAADAAESILFGMRWGVIALRTTSTKAKRPRRGTQPPGSRRKARGPRTERAPRSGWIDAWRVTVFCPITRETLAAAAGGDVAALERDPSTAPILGHLAGSRHFGNFGRYAGVCEASLGVELFTPTAAAAPTLGRAGERTQSATVAIRSYLAADVPAAELDSLVGELADLHPWEVPVIEVARVRLFRRAAGTARRNR